MKLFWLVLAIAMSSVDVVHAQSPQTLLKQYKCSLCHADDEDKTGPAYADVAVKYRRNPQAVAILAETIRRGAHGIGPWHMPPHPEVSKAEAEKMARYILSVRR